jgi:hypothetical protein
VTRIAATAACARTIRALSTAPASSMARKVAAARVQTPPAPSQAAPSPTRTPINTPASSRTALDPRRPSAALSPTTAATGAKKGPSWPATRTAISQATTAAALCCASGQAKLIHRCNAVQTIGSAPLFPSRPACHQGPLLLLGDIMLWFSPPAEH